MQDVKHRLLEKETYRYEDLLDLVRLLRSSEGCPWDREQTHKSVRSNLLEEAYEVAEGIDLDDPDILREELGDHLFEAAFHTVIEEERGRILPSEIINGICRKMIARHPHVFGDGDRGVGSDTILFSWDEQKRREKGEETVSDSMRAMPHALPALMYAKKLSGKAARVGFEFETAGEAAKKAEEEWRELSSAKTKEERTEELGDLLFALVNYARMEGIDAEEALNAASQKFLHRFAQMESHFTENRKELSNCTKNELLCAWNLVKSRAILKKNC